MRGIFTSEYQTKTFMDFILRTTNSNNWITITLLIALLLLATARLIKEQSFQRFITLFVSNKYLIIEQKQQPLGATFNVLLSLFQILSLSVFVHLAIKQFYPEKYIDNAFILGQIIAVCFLFSLGKLLIEKIIGVIFSFEGLMDQYLFSKLSYRNYLGILLFPINALLIYTLPSSTTLFSVLLMILIIGNLFTLILVFKMYRKLIFEQLFYFILYLCTLEIAPYYILYKLFEV